eukprot:2836948-Rhodomonas_salina.1
MISACFSTNSVCNFTASSFIVRLLFLPDFVRCCLAVFCGVSLLLFGRWSLRDADRELLRLPGWDGDVAVRNVRFELAEPGRDPAAAGDCE